jgi:hypothetical protein
MKTIICLLSFVLLPISLTSCTANSLDDDDGEGEVEPNGSSQDQLRSAVSCTEKAVTAYASGKAYAMKVVTLGGKSTAKATAHAFLKLQTAADKAGITLSVNSGFRSMAEQQHLYSCYQNKSCNNGNLAARPGYSNHQNGRAVDLATSNWTWLANNAGRFGFKRTVPSERWHYEFSGADPGGPCGGNGSGSAPADDEADDLGSTPTPPARPNDTDDTNDVPSPPARPDDVGGTGGCWSPTAGRTMKERACVQSSADDVFYQCHATLWYRGVSNGAGPYGTCTSTTSL